MQPSSPLTLVNPDTGNLAFRIYEFEQNPFDHLQRLNYYSMILVTEGEGTLNADFLEYGIKDNMLMCFTPYQPFMLREAKAVKGLVINFHPDFFCIHKHQNEVSCNGILFNNIYNPPFVVLQPQDTLTLKGVIAQMRGEMQNSQLAQYELLVSYLKIFLITAARIKVEQSSQALEDSKSAKEPFILQNLKEAIETHYKTKHSAADYALLLNITPKALGKAAKAHFNKTLTQLISERIIIEAKRELYLTSKTVKEIAYELGYEDEYYFSRFFKANADVSPQMYREVVGFAKAEVM